MRSDLLRKCVFAIALTVLNLFAFGCEAKRGNGRWHQKFNWDASEYFADTRIIKLCNAIEQNDLATMESLLGSGVKADTVGKGNMTPLLWAFPENRTEAFRLLLKHGANPNVQFSSQFNTRGGISVTDSVTMLAARSAFPDHLRWVLEHGGNPNITSETFNETPIHAVIGSIANPEVKVQKVRQLIAAGANLEHRCLGSTPLLAASRQPKVLVELLEAGADFDAETESGSRLIHLLASANLQASAELDRVLKILESKGESIVDAREDIRRWESYLGRSPSETKMLMEQDRERSREINASKRHNGGGGNQ